MTPQTAKELSVALTELSRWVAVNTFATNPRPFLQALKTMKRTAEKAYGEELKYADFQARQAAQTSSQVSES